MSILSGSWLKQAIHQVQKPKHSIISVLKQNLGGPELGRSMTVLHASDVTQEDFCPRRWAFFDILKKEPTVSYLSTALAVTFDMGKEVERMVVEEWAGQAAVGNWRCRHCGYTRTFTTKPEGHCKDGHKHWWQYFQVVVESEAYQLSGSLDCLFDVGAAQLMVTEIKILNTKEFEDIATPLPEHRYRTNLYLKIIASSNNPYMNKINLHEAKVLYVSRGYGKMNAQWNEILPFKEFTVKRDDESLKDILQKATALKLFRTEKQMPSGICATALDKYAKACSVCKECFSGQYPAYKGV